MKKSFRIVLLGILVSITLLSFNSCRLFEKDGVYFNEDGFSFNYHF